MRGHVERKTDRDREGDGEIVKDIAKRERQISRQTVPG